MSSKKEAPRGMKAEWIREGLEAQPKAAPSAIAEALNARAQQEGYDRTRPADHVLDALITVEISPVHTEISHARSRP